MRRRRIGVLEAALSTIDLNVTSAAKEQRDRARLSRRTNRLPVNSLLVTVHEILQGNADDSADFIQLQKIHAADTVLVFAYNGLLQPEGISKILLAQSGLLPDST
jgi:hypothetical protein